jgi:hypothetical protein
MKDAEAQVLATDCPLAAIQIEQAIGVRPLNPVEILARAYEADGFAEQRYTDVPLRVGQTFDLPVQLAVQPIRMWVCRASEVVNPNGGIHDDHPRLAFWNPAPARTVQVSFPFHLAAILSDGRLGMRTHQQTQAGFDSGFFRSRAAAAHGLFD